MGVNGFDFGIGRRGSESWSPEPCKRAGNFKINAEPQLAIAA